MVLHCTGSERESDCYLRGAKVSERRMAKRETNKERAAREQERRTILQVANNITRLIKNSSESKAVLRPASPEESAETIHAFIGATICATPGNIPKFLRLVADFLEGREPYNPGSDWYDKAIKAAYKEALRRHRPYVPPGAEDIKE